MARAVNPSNVKFVLRASLTLTLVIIIGVFITDWWFLEKGSRILDGALVGVMIGIPLGWWSSKMIFYFPTSKGKEPDDGDSDSESG